MKLILNLIILFHFNCENFGILGTGGVSGKVVKSEIREILQTNSILNWGYFANRINIPVSVILPSVVLTFSLDGVIINGLEGIRDNEKYSRPSVDLCKKNLSDLNLLFTLNGSISITGAFASTGGNAIAPIPSASVLASILKCELKTTPEILQIGNGEQGKLIQIGPIGL